MGFIGRIFTVALAWGASFSTVCAADHVTFGTNWLAEAEHGGFYQAVVDGTYAKFGLDVTILPGGPQANNRLLLPVGKIDFYMGGNMLQAYAAVEQNVPTEVVAAMFQKDPQIFMSHPGVGMDKFEDLKKATIFVGKEGLASFYLWMEQAYGFSDDKVKPYTFNTGPFLADKMSAQQGYLTAEPFAVERQGGFKPNIFLLADYGFSTYATTIETRTALVTEHPDLVQRFVDASTIGWYNYLYGDNAKANAAIKKDNPDITDDEDCVLHCQDEAIWDRRFGRHGQPRHRGHDRCPSQGLLRQDGEGPRCLRRCGLQEGLYAPVREQEGRARSAAQAMSLDRGRG